jgi:hypothetical protein
VIRPRLWPFGEARVHITLEDTGEHTRIVIEEQFSGGPLLVLRNQLNDMILGRRNRESLRRLGRRRAFRRAAGRLNPDGHLGAPAHSLLVLRCRY